MNLESRIFGEIVKECDKLRLRYHAYHNNVHKEWVRNRKRIENPSPKEIKVPEYWESNRLYNPFYVRSNAKAIARSIARKIEAGVYVPVPPIEKLIQKSSGGYRTISIYQIPDAAVSRLFYERLLSKNKHRFSSFSYAYRNDRNVHFAIQDISLDIERDSRTFIAEFDFSDFFGSIRHDYLLDQLHVNGFAVSGEEEIVIKSFLKGRDKGIPQGTSISLFLANLVCWQLDKSLEKEGLRFARYADDTVIWSQDYTRICKSFELIEDFSKRVGVRINVGKSDGISLLSSEGMATEINAKNSFDFLGYSIGVGVCSIKKSAERRIKKQISYIFYRNLIQPVQVVPFGAFELDRNLLVAIMHVRRYMYGGLSRDDLNRYLGGRKRWLNFKGVMSFYPLVNNERQLKELDGWLLSVAFRSIRRRAALLGGYSTGFCSHPLYACGRSELLLHLNGNKVKREGGFELPSFFLMYKALKKGLLDAGIERVMHPESVKYDYME
ncbi:reverse transcriptase domain-containing protein [Crenobacter intestini]|uniref:RNA-dependent DNA polymerase n=1 Tax=Crenobacter intestini TaxID=2563443 RepID=A0A4T0UM52_9NEIS|nr:reverse transcriptase domain-containing protein [Crenobacter intestini]TIC79804.1 RNA-dependent DNA polymerase [Crenobacter intestini]